MKRFCLGLTGSIGMGKSTTAALFAAQGIAVWDADAAVHRLYSKGGAAVAEVARLFPQAIENGAVSRPKLREVIAADPTALDLLQSVIHPLVAADRQDFLANSPDEIVVLDIPLLFEIGAGALCDGIAVVSAPPEVQRQRVLARGQMTEAEFDIILSRQMPDADKRARATWVIPTDTPETAQQAVTAILNQIRERIGHA